MPQTVPKDEIIYLPEHWKLISQKHHHRINRLLGDYLDKREHQFNNPVLDFLFEYYSFRPSLLKRWSPGIDAVLTGRDARKYLKYEEYEENDRGITLDPSKFSRHRIDSILWILELLKKTQQHSPSLGCFGMHEWAMVYRTNNIRHNYLPLRLPPEEIAQIVESRSIICSHYDAFRFFSPKARPLNKLQPSRKNLKKLEQPGCIHANMDLYKWAYKMYPWISSDLIADAFELALDARVIDMKASPYDLKTFGYGPIRIETEEGRLEYKNEQRRIYKRSQPIRKKLIEYYERLLARLSIND